jgi:hypothetical protein
MPTDGGDARDGADRLLGCRRCTDRVCGQRTGRRAAARVGAYVDNGDGTITDAVTGLMWEKLSDDGSIHDADAAYGWPEALAVSSRPSTRRRALPATAIGAYRT